MASTSLCLAAIQGHTAVVRVLLDVGAQVGAQGRTGYVPLVPAGTNGAEGYPEMMDRLLDRGADIGAVMKRKTGLVPGSRIRAGTTGSSPAQPWRYPLGQNSGHRV